MQNLQDFRKDPQHQNWDDTPVGVNASVLYQLVFVCPIRRGFKTGPDVYPVNAISHVCEELTFFILSTTILFMEMETLSARRKRVRVVPVENLLCCSKKAKPDSH